MIMAHYANKHASLLLVLLLLSFTLNIEARESKFFSKTTHDTKDNRDTELTTTVLAPVPAPAPEIDPSIIGEGYGLYGHISDDKSNDMKTKRNQEKTRYPYNTKDNKYENNGYQTKGYKNDNYKNGNYDHSYDDNGYVSGRFGQISDTRFSQDGKYFDNIENMNNYNGHGAESGLGGEREGYYGNNENEFDTMEEYEKQQGYPEIQGEYYDP